MDALSFELPKAVARFSSSSKRCISVSEAAPSATAVPSLDKVDFLKLPNDINEFARTISTGPPSKGSSKVGKANGYAGVSKHGSRAVSSRVVSSKGSRPETIMVVQDITMQAQALLSIKDSNKWPLAVIDSHKDKAREFVIPANVEQNGRVDNYSFPEQRLQQVPETENILEDNFAVQSNGSLQSTLNLVREHLSTPVEEPVGEAQKHTYASILQVAKGQSAPAVPAQSSFNKTTPPGSEWNHVSESSSQPAFAPSVTVDMFRTEAVEGVSAIEDEGEIKSVYVRNVPSTASAFEIEEEFKKFGKLKPDGVAIRTRKDIDVCYAFVEFEDIAGVQNAIKASTVQIAGQQVYVEGRRANRINVFRGGRGRGRGRGSYHMDASRGHSGAHNFSRGSGQDGDYSRPKGNGNGYYRLTSRQERPFSGSQQVSRNGSNLSK